jgi:hypothetical protein
MSGTTYNQWGVPQLNAQSAPAPAPVVNTGGGAPFWGNPLFGGNWYQQQQAPGALSPTATSLLGQGIQPAWGDMASLWQQLPQQQQQAANGANVWVQPSGGAVGASGYNRWGQQATPQPGAVAQQPQMNPLQQQQLGQYLQASPQDWNSPAGMVASGINSQMDMLSRAFGVPMAAWSPSDVHGLLGSALGGGGGGGSAGDQADTAAAAAEHEESAAAAGHGGSNIYG